MTRPSFFNRSVHDVARDLIGCTLLCEGVGGVIVETESYAKNDPACHANNGPTERSKVLFGPPGRTYVYFTYGMHNMLNFVAEPEGTVGAVLVRALEPTDGIEVMQSRRGKDPLEDLCSGPAKLTQALGIELAHNDQPVGTNGIAVTAREGDWLNPEIVTGPRIGIRKAVNRPWRYCVADSRFVSKPRPIGSTAP